jgi:hypothetical protein
LIGDDPRTTDDSRFTLFDLQKHANQPLDRDFHGYEGNNLKPLKKGRQSLGKIAFEVGDKFIQLASKRAPDWPEQVTGIAAGVTAARLHFLHGTGWPATDGMEIGSFTVHYDDDSKIDIPIEYGVDVQDWWDFGRGEPPKRAEVVWRDVNEASANFRGQRIEIRLFKLTWSNPHPEKTISSLDYTSKNESSSAPFLISVTADREASDPVEEQSPDGKSGCGDESPGAGRDDSPSEKEQEAIEVLKQVGAFLELDSHGHAVEVSLSGPGLNAQFNRGSDQVVGLLAWLPQLERAYLNSAGISDEGMAALGKVTSVGWLSLNFTRITDAGLKELAEMTQLERLRLHSTQITDEGLQHLKGMSRLRVLDLSKTRVTDSGLPALYGLEDLELLDLRNTSVTDDGVALLQDSLPQVAIKH